MLRSEQVHFFFLLDVHNSRYIGEVRHYNGVKVLYTLSKINLPLNYHNITMNHSLPTHPPTSIYHLKLTVTVTKSVVTNH